MCACVSRKQNRNNMTARTEKGYGLLKRKVRVRFYVCERERKINGVLLLCKRFFDIASLSTVSVELN